MFNSIKHISLLVMLVISIAGCTDDPRPDGMPKLYPCFLTITQDGKPLEGASVTLIAEEPDLEKWAAGGYTDEKGGCELQVRGKFRGVPAGKFKVTVDKIIPEKSKIGDTPPEGLSPEETELWWEKRSREKLNSVRFVAVKYILPATTDLQVEILPESNSFTFDVGSPVRIIIAND